MDQVLSGTFHQAGFRVTEATDVEPYSGGKFHVAAVQEDYKSGMDLKSQTLQDVEVGLRNAKIPYPGPRHAGSSVLRARIRRLAYCGSQ